MTSTDSMDAAAFRVDLAGPGWYKETPLQERGRGQVVAHPAPPLTTTAGTVVAMFPVSILAILAVTCTPDFCPEVLPMI